MRNLNGVSEKLNGLRAGVALSGLLLGALGIPAVALAQDAPEAAATDEADDIVVTGSLIRGKSPVGSQQIALGQAQLMTHRDYMPRTWRALERNLATPGMEGLQAWFDRHVPAEARA